MSSPEEASRTVSDLQVSGSKPPENMALGNRLAKSTNLPRMIRSLMRGVTVGNDGRLAVGRMSTGTEVETTGG